LLEILSKENEQDWTNSRQHTHVWYDTLEDVVTFYVSKVKEYGARYMDSVAGKKVKTAVMRSRKSSKALPTVDTDVLREYDGAEGIAWGLAEVYDIFKILSEVTDVQPVVIQVRY